MTHMASAGVRQPSGDWTTGGLPAALRTEGARTVLSTVHLPWDLTLADRADYGLRLAWSGLGGCTLIECHTSPLAGRRGGNEVRRTEGDYAGLLFVLAGRERVRQGEVSQTLGPGDLILWDGTVPADFEVLTPLHKVTLLIPRQRLEYRLPYGNLARGAHRLDARRALGSLLVGHLAGLSRIARSVAAGDAPFAVDVAVDLLARLLAPADPPRQAGRLAELVLERIEARLDDPDLSPTTLAEELGVTPRYLHMIFAATGRTLSAHIRARRLDRIRRDLADPRQRHLSITDIVFRWGFSDASHASRAFHNAYGLSPARFRTQAAGSSR